MADNTALVNIGELSKPATVLIEKISGAVGAIFEPWQLRRVAKAERDVARIKALTQIEVTELQHRGLQRFIAEEARMQSNIESITAKALPQLLENAQPQTIEDDWITNFFDKSRLISDEEMQTLWSKILAAEANSPGTYSKRTVNFLSSLDKSDAVLFQSLCNFGWLLEKTLPLIYATDSDIYKRNGVTFESLKHLDEIGLISFEVLAGYVEDQLPKRVRIAYHETPIDIEFEKESDNQFDVGYVLLSKVGQELAPICGSKPVPEFFDYILERWVQQMGLVVSSPISLKNSNNVPLSA